MNAPTVDADAVDAEDVLHSGARELVGDLAQALGVRQYAERTKSDVPEDGVDDVRIAPVKRRNFPAEERGRSLALDAEEHRAGSGGGGAGYIRLNTTSGSANVTGTLSPSMGTCTTQGTLAR